MLHNILNLALRFCLCCMVPSKGLKQPKSWCTGSSYSNQSTVCAATNRLLYLWKMASSSIMSAYLPNLASRFRRPGMFSEVWKCSADAGEKCRLSWEVCRMKFVFCVCIQSDWNPHFTHRVKVFRGRKVHGEFDIKVEQVGFTYVAVCFILC